MAHYQNNGQGYYDPNARSQDMRYNNSQMRFPANGQQQQQQGQRLQLQRQQLQRQQSQPLQIQQQQQQQQQEMQLRQRTQESPRPTQFTPPLESTDMYRMPNRQPTIRQEVYQSENNDSTIHYGLAPTRQPRRYKTTRKVELYKGNLVLDCRIPTKLEQTIPLKDDGEFTHLRYTACTCDPNDFEQEQYHLRQQLYSPKRETELFIVLTMYNEDEVLFARTFHGVVKNIAHLCKRERSKVWGKEGWKKVVVCVVSDGRKKINQRTLSYLAAIGCYQDGVAKNAVNGRPVTAHIYEYTTQISIDPEMNFCGADKGTVPIQVLFCLKEKNAKKINSHRWFFNAFGALLQPHVCVLLDVGTKPGGSSIYHLWKAFDRNGSVAGACGEIVAMKGTAGVNLLNPLVACQNFEYKMSNILDKPLESVFGYITVLPGAFSAYRYLALQNDKKGRGPLASYFLGEKQHGADADIFTANMYLAEDRILCYELVAKRHCSWLLHYVKSAYAETDVPDQVPELISQRRRWLNGSFFAGVYAILHTLSIWRSNHGIFRKILLHVEMAYQSFNLAFSWFALGNFYLTFHILGNSLSSPEVVDGLWSPTVGNITFQLLRYVYLSLLIVSFILSMGNRPQGSKWSYTFAMVFYAGLMGYMLFAAGWLTYKGIGFAMEETGGNISSISMDGLKTLFQDQTFRNVVLSLVSTYGLYFIASFLFFEPWHMFTSFVQYMFLVPFYVNILNVYAFCNTHDVSWGTKGDNSTNHDLGTVTSNPEKGTVEIDAPIDQVDINRAYEDAVNTLSKPHVEEEQKRDASTKQEDYYRAFRTRVVLAWIFSNAALVVIITSTSADLDKLVPQSERTNLYMAFVLWSVAGLAAFRFVGSCIYLIFRIFSG